MLYLYLGFASATLFAIGVAALFGSDAVLSSPWVDYTFWALILAGVVLAALENAAGLWCRVCRQVAVFSVLCRPPCRSAAT
jgi:hypothetical protein